MNIKCPKCGRDVAATSDPAGFRCPACDALLVEEETGEGFVLIGVKKEAEKDRQRAELVQDPIIEDYAKWQLGAVFSILLGLFLAFMVATPLVEQALAPRPFAGAGSSSPWLWAALWSGLSLLFVVGGVIVFFKARASSRAYEAWVEEEPTSTEKS